MISALVKAVEQLSDPKLRRVFWKGFLGAIAAFILLYTTVFLVVDAIAWTEIPWIGGAIEWMGGYFDWFAAVFGGATILALTYFLFPAVLVGVMGIFLEEVCEAVEAKHYPNAGPARDMTIVENLWSALQFLGIVVVINILAMPLYVLTIWIAGLGIILYYLINGYLFGREYYELVSHRRMPAKSAGALRRAHRGRIMLAGCATAFAMTIPILNLFVPIISAAMMVHIYMTLPKRKDYMEATDLAQS